MGKSEKRKREKKRKNDKRKTKDWKKRRTSWIKREEKGGRSKNRNERNSIRQNTG